MKMQELASLSKTKQTVRVMESYFDKTISFDKMQPRAAQHMLHKVRYLMHEQQQQDFHNTHQNPAYLKLVILEQGLIGRLEECNTSSYRTLRESEIQQAQVVLAAQDIVDQMQKMVEQVTSIQFKDLPALVEQIKNEIGVDQSLRFNQDATAALGNLVQNLQDSKQQMEAAVGVVTGQEPAALPTDLGADPAAAAAPAAPAAPAGPPELAAPDAVPPSSFGRAKR